MKKKFSVKNEQNFIMYSVFVRFFPTIFLRKLTKIKNL
jgi:hypothetical protein